jgi:hypothetical protein
MKKKTASLIHPKGRLGRRYWSQVYRILGWKKACVTVRQWIVPTQATVHQNDGELYILKAPLSVKLRSQQFKTAPAGINASCGKYDPALQARIEAVYRRLVLPRVQRAVRTAREFAALRRVYFSRIAAEWYRERAAARNGRAFASIVDSGDISPWAPKRAWTPRDVFDRYVTSYTKGEFNVKHRVRVGNLVGIRTYVWGGVDFSRVPRRNVSPRELATIQPGLARLISTALSQPAVDPQSGEVWLAGTSFDPAAAAEDPAFGGGGFHVSTLILGLLAVFLIPLLAYLSRIATASAVRPQHVMQPAVDQTAVVDQTPMKRPGWGAKLNSYRTFFVSAFVIAFTLCITLFLVSQIRDSQRRAAKEAQIRNEQYARESQQRLDRRRREMEWDRQRLVRQTQQIIQAVEEARKDTCRAVPDLPSCNTRPPP